MLLLDTSALLEGQTEGILLMCVIEELDNLKTQKSLTGKLARDVIKRIYRGGMESFYDEREEFSEVYQANSYADPILLEVAARKGYELITADLSLHLKAKGRGIGSIFIEKNNNQLKLKPTMTYIESEDYAKILEGTYNKQHPENHFLVFQNEAYRIIEGEPSKVPYTRFISPVVNEIKARNVEQKCLIDLLFSEVPVVAVHSKYGCGKSYLMLNYLLGQIGNNGHYKKLIVIPNNSSVADSKEVGLLPGDILDKEMSFLGPLIDLLGPDRLREKMEREEIEVVPIAFARGRNWDNSLVFVSESQNLTDYHIKLLLGRMGENSRIFFDGDVRQEDSRVFADNSGLVLLHKLAQTDSSKLFGSVELKSIERSMVARLADVLDDIKG